MYPASLLHDRGFVVSMGYVFFSTLSKSILLISLYNVQGLLEDPFNQNGPDDIRLNDFRFLAGITADDESSGVALIADRTSF